MHHADLDHIIVYSFLLVTFFIGLFAGKGAKTIEAYTIAHKIDLLRKNVFVKHGGYKTDFYEIFKKKSYKT